MARRRGYALLSAITALIIGLSAAIYAGVSAGEAGAVASGRDGGGAGPGRGDRVAPASTGVWTGTWGASPVAGEPGTGTDGMAGRSVRNVVHTSVGGTSARVTLSNLYGTGPLTFTHATLALAAGGDGAGAAAGTMRRVTFGGSTTVTLPAGAEVTSDPVRLLVPADSDVLVTTYSPTASGPVTSHPHARQTNYLADGEHTADLSGTAYVADRADRWRYLTALDVSGRAAEGTVVALGDSLTDGVTSTVDADRRWPDVLADRLREAVDAGSDVPLHGVVNEGISGNRVLTDGTGRPAENQSGLHRFQRDVLGRPGVRVVVIDLGINDILRDPKVADPERILGGLRTLVQRAHAHGIKVVGATLMPFEGHRGYDDAREGVRQEVNAAIRQGRVFDAVADFDAALRDPYDPRRFRPDYDSGDHLHPSDKGYRVMARTVRLDDLRTALPARL
ncbi:SGNH/GDSL hydrolase family protein [Streptomyces longwoodensis]|uniref:SGNH/GDSL hydrolase family protein n=1 Tax=Streptomyces longwoodensis TaxID=68231 RepID=UPI0033C0F834